MFLPRTMPVLRSWTVTFVVIVFACVQISSAGGSRIQYFGRKVLVEGDSLEIICLATLFEPIVWQKDGKTLVSGFGGYVWHTSNENNVIKSILKVSHVKLHHSGSYQCTPVRQESHQVFIVSAKLVFEADHGGDVSRYKVIKKNVPLELRCSIDEASFTITWQKDGEDLKDYPVTVEPFKDGKETSILKILKPGDSDAGLYSCLAKNNSTEPDGVLKDSVEVVSLPTGSLEQDIIVVEGEKLTLDCQPTGIPMPKVTWYFMKDGNNSLNTSNERYKFLPHNNITNAVLEIRDVQMSDRGEYRCVLTNTATMFVGPDITLKTNVRVKDKLAALWPFLGICAEVIVLCAIIFIYEKKRNKAELDESDTDNSPEQKNTPDHGKDSVRQRK